MTTPATVVWFFGRPMPGPVPPPRTPGSERPIGACRFCRSHPHELFGKEGLCLACYREEYEPREPGCQCQLEAVDSPCRVHGEEEPTP